jgi:hypothetical protein
MLKWHRADTGLRTSAKSRESMNSSSFDRLRRRGWRDGLGALALLGLLLRALLPAGFMPTSAHGEVRLVLCSVPGAALAHSGHLPSGSSDNTPCPFAASASAPAPQLCKSARAPILLRVARVSPLYRSPSDTAPLRHTAARGPPLEV